jgi:hypothetical protein
MGFEPPLALNASEVVSGMGRGKRAFYRCAAELGGGPGGFFIRHAASQLQD